MPYGPHTPEDRAKMLAAIGVGSVDELFSDIPVALRADGLDLPPPQPEIELSARLLGLAARNRVDVASFLGAGVYRHFAPAAVDQLLLRGEWYTAYTPYQPEVSQGTLQSIYEYASLIGELTGVLAAFVLVPAVIALPAMRLGSVAATTLPGDCH
jgi:glycine dehydrogenase subunit 1